MQGRIIKALTLLLLMGSAWTPNASAQTGKGTVSGTVMDTGNSALIGAVVKLLPLGRQAVTDDQGQYRFTEVPAGEYTISASYVGFSVFNASVQVEAGKMVTADAKMQVASQEDKVMVTAERLQGEAEAINIERTADDIVQVLPERVINSLPNTNIADAVGRLPSVTLERDEGEGKYVQIRGTEPRLNNVTVNGVNVPAPEVNVRNIKLDAVPADLVERIEVFKTLSASQDADGIGGTVNLVTKTAGERPTYTFATQTGYNNIQNGFWRGGFDGTLGQRFVNKKLGFILSGTYDKTNRGIDDLEPNPIVGSFNGQNVAIFSTEDMRSYDYYRTRYGLAEGLDYVIKPGVNVYVKGLYSDFHDFGDTRVYTPNAGNIIKSVNGTQITFDNAADCAPLNAANPGSCSPGNFVYRHYVRRPDQQVYSFLTGARHDLSSTLITYEFAASRGHNFGGQDFATTHFGGPTTDLALSTANPLIPKFTPLDGVNVFDPTLYSVSDTSFGNYHATQLNFQGAAAVSRRYSVHSHFGTFEVGLKIRNSHSTQSQIDQFYNFTGANPFTIADTQGTYTNPTYYQGALKIGNADYGPTTNYTNILQGFAANMGQFQLDQVRSITNSAQNFFDANERVYAGYIENGISIGKFRLQSGLRFEGTNTNFLTNQLTANVDSMGNPLPPTIAPISQSSSYVKVLPSAQVQYQLEKNTNLRGSFSIGISRPNIGDLVPTTNIDPNTSPKSLSIGNPDLKPTRANNYDVLIEHYFQPLGILQAGFFYKQLYDPIYQTQVLLQSGPNAGFFQTSKINGPSAYLTGFEAAWEQRFSFLPGLLNGFGVAANYSYTTSQATFPVNSTSGRIDHPTLQRQAPNTWNAGVTYDKARLSVRFAVSHNDANIAAYGYTHNTATPLGDNDPLLGLKGPFGDNYFYAHTQYDIQGSYRVYKGLQFVASGLNLSNEVFGFYNGSTIYPVQREFYKPTVSFGMRWTGWREGSK
jgi:TonB-dependent receptor